jgi:hypothetical protein
MRGSDGHYIAGVFFPELSPTVVIIVELLCAIALSEISLDAQARPLSIGAAQAHALSRHLNGSRGNAFRSKTSSSGKCEHLTINGCH